MTQSEQQDPPVDVAGEGPTDPAAPVVLPADLSLPRVGRRERLSMRAAIWGALVWGVLLAAVYFLPVVWEVSVAWFDAILWPLFSAFGDAGRWWGVGLLAVLTAWITMACQWLCTDVRSLREVKRRIGLLRDAQAKTPIHSPEDKAYSAEIRRGDWRIARAAFVPLGLLLGPVMMTFMWLPARVDAVHINPAPGQGVQVQAGVDGEFSGPMRLDVAGASVQESLTPAHFELVSVRQTLGELRLELLLAEEGSPATSAVTKYLAETGKSPKAAREALEALLANPMPPRVLQWTLTTPPDRSGVVSVVVEAGEKGELGRGRMELATGNARPPALAARQEKDQHLVTEPGEGAIRDVRLSFADPRPTDQRTYWRPFAWSGWNWDGGWLTLYLLAYLPAMYVGKRLFRLP